MATKKAFVAKHGLNVGTTVVFGTNGKLHANNTIDSGTITDAMLSGSTGSNLTKVQEVETNLLSTNTAIRTLVSDNETARDTSVTSAIAAQEVLSASARSTIQSDVDTKFDTAGGTITGATAITGNFTPSANNTYDLGTAAMVWRDVHIGPGSLYVNGTKVIEDNAGTIIVQADLDQSLTVKTTGTGETNLQSATGVNLTATGSADVTITTTSGNIEAKGNLQILTGKRISDSAATKVEFGDDIDMNSNKIIEVGTPTGGSDAANKTYVDTAVAALANSAPVTLNTLNELAAALGDDANYATTMTTNLGQKLGASATVALTGDITGSATAFSSNAVSISTSLATDSVAANEIAASAVGASELNVTGNGTSGQFLASDGDGTMTWTTQADNDTVYTHPTTAGNKHIPTAGASGQFLKYSASGTAVWASDNNTTYSVGDGGLTTNDFTNADHTKLNAIEASADVTDTTNVTAAGALMDSELAGLAAVKATTGTFLTADQSKLDGIASSATNVTNNNQITNGAGYITSYTNTTYSADGNYGMALSGTAFRLEDDRRRNSSTTDVYSGNTHDYTFYDASHGIRWYTAGVEEMRLEDDGDLHVDGDVVAYSTTVSDKRLKQDIKPIENALDKVNQLNGCTFTYINDGKESAGLIAQDVEKVLPSAVSEKELPLKKDDGVKYKTVQYDQVIGLLVESIKEQQVQIEELQAKLK